MAILSSLRRFVVGGGLGSRLNAAASPSSFSSPIGRALNRVGVRHGSGGGAGAGGHGRKLVVMVSEYHKRRILDEFHYQICLVSLPILAIIFYANVIIGKATLSEIPEGYEPEEWEYHKSPITRFWAKYLVKSEPLVHEIEMSIRHREWLDIEKIEWEKKVAELMQERQDYKAWYFIPADALPLEKANAVWLDRIREEGGGPRGLGGRLQGDYMSSSNIHG